MWCDVMQQLTTTGSSATASALITCCIQIDIQYLGLPLHSILRSRLSTGLCGPLELRSRTVCGDCWHIYTTYANASCVPPTSIPDVAHDHHQHLLVASVWASKPDPPVPCHACNHPRPTSKPTKRANRVSVTSQTSTAI